MNIRHTSAPIKPSTNWFTNRQRTPGVIGPSVAEDVRDTVACTVTSGLVGLGAAAVTHSMGAGVLGAVGLAVPMLVAGGLSGGLLCGLTQEGIGALMGARPGHDAGTGAIAGGAVMSALVATGSTVAAGLGADPLTTGLVAGATGGGLLLLAGLAARSTK